MQVEFDLDLHAEAGAFIAAAVTANFKIAMIWRRSQPSSAQAQPRVLLVHVSESTTGWFRRFRAGPGRVGKRYRAEVLALAEVDAPIGARNRVLITIVSCDGLHISAVLALRPSGLGLASAPAATQ